MNANSPKNSEVSVVKLCATLAAFVFPAAIFAACPLTGTVSLNFDSVSVPSSAYADATAYLNANGITFQAITTGLIPLIAGPAASAAIPSSPPNSFIVDAPGSGAVAVSYQLNFCAPVTSVAFTRTGMASQVTPGDPSWTATALNSQY